MAAMLRSPTILTPTLRPAAAGLAFATLASGAIYCQAHAFVVGTDPIGVGQSLLWSVATLSPWLLALAAFERREPRVGRAVVLALAAAVVASVTASFLGSEFASSLYARLPAVPIAVAYAALRIRLVQQAPPARAAGEALPCAPADIRLATSAENYVQLELPHRRLLWRQTMQGAESQLAPHGFVRVHRSYLVPRAAIAAVGSSAVELRDGRRVPVSRRYRAQLGC